MKNKKNPTRFTVRFNPKILSHLQAMKVINSVSERGKAQLIADALLLYNQTIHSVDVSNVDDIVELVSQAEIEAEKEKENKKEMKEVEKTTSEEKIDSGDTEDDNDGFLELEYDDDDDEYDEYEEDDAFDKLIKDNLAMMGFTKKKKGKDE
jgi:hypothetical protein